MSNSSYQSWIIIAIFYSLSMMQCEWPPSQHTNNFGRTRVWLSWLRSVSLKALKLKHMPHICLAVILYKNNIFLSDNCWVQCGSDLGKKNPKRMLQAIVRDCWRVTAEEEIRKQNRSKRLRIYFHLSPHLFKEGCYSRCKRTDLKVSLAWVLDHCYAWYLGNIFPLTSRYSRAMTPLKSFIKSLAFYFLFVIFGGIKCSFVVSRCYIHVHWQKN